ncbi:glycosyl transferase family 4 [Dechloromonas sp. XY25]|uniref:Glycosyl transferase family 4 n=1 Tax=Dechloromonas hankyongensis TaxID=2908002 RepID=A0ABS9JZE7_9RHOO|nr:glycosyl transferase family 4 [Dechloromonas hankyongensis]MCG2576280.1 glycosyl transferase family 4 [Dechloromonas hankyongensis]
MAASLAGFGLVLLYGWSLGWGVICLGALLAAVGLQDDIHQVSVRSRFGIQILVSAGFLALLGELPALSFLSSIKFEIAGWLLSALLLLVGVWWINLFNFMDGIDGIAAVQAVFMLLLSALMAAEVQPEAMADPAWLFMLSVAAAVLGFLLLNWPPARIFMGDVGSTWLGFVIFALGLISVQKGWLNYAAWLVWAEVFVVDATVTLLTRLARGERWYEAHSSHAYQRLSRRWQGAHKVGHRSVTLLVMIVNVLWVAPWAWACLNWPEWSPTFVVVAYVPLVLAVLWLGAGRPDEFSGDETHVRS